jgi:hypothetical protein
MNDQDSDWLFQLRPYGTKDARRAERWMKLALALWGGSSADLQCQLLAPSPGIPSGFDSADFQELFRHLQIASVGLNDPRKTWAYPGPVPTIVVGSERFTLWEARCEIVRRAIEYLD